MRAERRCAGNEDGAPLRPFLGAVAEGQSGIVLPLHLPLQPCVAPSETGWDHPDFGGWKQEKRLC